MQNNAKIRVTMKTVIIRVLIGIAIVALSVMLSAGADMKEAYSVLNSTTTYIKEQCNRYSLISLSSESKSLTRLIEGCKNTKMMISGKGASVSNADLLECVRSNYLTGIILMDKKGNIVSEYSKDKNTDYLLDEYLKNDSLLDVASLPKKQYAVRYSISNGDELDIAAICREDTEGIIVAFFHTKKAYKESFSLNVESLLEGFEMENSGTIVVCDNESVIASNNKSLKGKNPESIEIINAIQENNSSNKGVKAKEEASSIHHSYGMMKKGRDVFIYAYMPEREIYSNIPFVVIVVLLLYIIGIGLLDHTRTKASREFQEKQLKLKEEYALNLEEKNEALSKAVDKANRANAAKSNFLSRMSHDIRTPINGIVGLIKINKNHFDETEMVLENLDKMQIAADHLLSLINDILQMSKIEDGTVSLTHEFVDFREISFEINSLLEQKASENDISVDFSLGKSKKFPNVYGSPVHLRQIFLNIYTNSIKYTNAGGRITTKVDVFNLTDDSCTYQWTIEDTGIGMNEEFVKRIFDPFTQEKNDARTYYQGVGLGMSIVKGLLDEMGGTISVSSKEGVGSKFVITIPFEIAHEKDNTNENPLEDKEDISGLSILLAEDNELNAEIADITLRDYGAKVTRVTNGKQAVDLFSEKPTGTFDAILMDVMMPVMDGISATKKIREINRPDAKEIPIIAMTANAFEEDRRKCLNAGMSAHLSKPLDIDKVVQTISEQIKRDY